MLPLHRPPHGATHPGSPRKSTTRHLRRIAVAALAVLAAASAACGRDDDRLSTADTAGLGADLRAAGSIPAAAPMDTVSALERTGSAAAAAAPVATRSGTSGTAARRRTPSSARTTTASSGEVSSGSSAGAEPAPPATRTVIEKNTKRDAIIGAAAGAAIGAATSDNKARGAVIGGVVGGVLGGVIGNNVDVKKKKVPVTP